jgi:hypothetical protein
MRFLLIITTIAIATLVGCATSPIERPETSPFTTSGCCRSAEALPSRDAIAATAAELIGASVIEQQGRHIAYDCAGVTRAIYLQHGIDLYESAAHDPQANGVRLIYNHLRQYGRLHQGPVVAPGDLVFFDNTWDVNGDGLVNDRLTHVGVVERIERDGSVVFVSRVANAIKRYRMNLTHPHRHQASDGRILNDYMRRKQPGHSETTSVLTGELFAFFGTRIRP